MSASELTTTSAIEAKPAEWIWIWVWTSHFEGSHTSHDWQPYEVQVVERQRNSIVVYSRRLIEDRKPLHGGNRGLFRLRAAHVKFEEPHV